MFNEETLEISGSMGCHLRVLAVGGGGLRGYAYPNILLGTGAGSGDITNSNIKFPCESFKVSLKVGGPGEASTIKIDDISDTSAKPGGNCIMDSVYTSGVGGNGYSGGEYLNHQRTTRLGLRYPIFVHDQYTMC